MEDVKSKQCSKCGEIKPITEYYGQWKYPKTKDPYYSYQGQCKECTRRKQNKYRLEHLEEIANYREEWYKENKHIQLDNAKRWRKENREKLNDYFNEYYSNNKDKFKSYREFRNQNKTHDIVEQEWLECLEYFNYTCAYCGISEEDAVRLYGQLFHKEHVDHFGQNDITNCVPACKSCNSQKWEFSLNEWYNENNIVYDNSRYDKIVQWLISFTSKDAN